jgi:GT2 family glycosyltransferase
MVALEKPAGARVEWFAGGVNVATNRNVVAAHFTGDWLCMIDDDQVFAPDLLHRLLRHLADDRVDIVVPLILRRNPPYAPCLLVTAPPKAVGARVVELQEPRSVRYVLKQLKLTNQRGLQAVEAAGSGIMLVRRRVFERIPPPWFERRGGLGDDFHFCLKARAADCGVYCDVGTTAGHVAPMAVWPTRQANGRWGTSFSYVHLGQLGIVTWFVARDSKAKKKTPRRKK